MSFIEKLFNRLNNTPIPSNIPRLWEKLKNGERVVVTKEDAEGLSTNEVVQAFTVHIWKTEDHPTAYLFYNKVLQSISATTFEIGAEVLAKISDTDIWLEIEEGELPINMERYHETNRRYADWLKEEGGESLSTFLALHGFSEAEIKDITGGIKCFCNKKRP